MSGRARTGVVALLVSLMGAGCATTTAPAGYLPDTRAVQTNVYGGWIDVMVQGGAGPRRVTGELIAATRDTLWVLSGAGVGSVVPTSTVLGGELVAYDSEAGGVAAGALTGVLSTLSNGALLLITAPAWIIVGAAAAGAQSRLPITNLPPATWEDLASFARFPQGLPSGVSFASLKPRP
jgi:hypothetical protein